MKEIPERRPDEKILDFLRENSTEKFSMLEISRRIGISYVTVQKYVIILENKGLIKVEDFGNIKVISLRKEYGE